MASQISCPSFLVVLLFLCSLHLSFASEITEADLQHSHRVHLTSLFPSSTC
ncbi:hypothetical protein L6164_029443, partial [Bauhinia variegata]